jgi:Domain of unknown function (DUF4333)
MNGPAQPGSGHDPEADTPWRRRRPTSDDQTAMARPRPTPPRTPPPRQYPSPPPPPASRQPPAGQRPPPPPNIPWYLQRPHRPQPPAPAVQHQNPTAKPKDTLTADRKTLLRWILIGAGSLPVLIEAALLLSGASKLGIAGGAVLDVTKVQTGVLQTLSDPASGYGANTVTDVSCNNGHNPSADKGTTFTCDVTVNGAQRHVTVVVSDDNGTYEIDGPR